MTESTSNFDNCVSKHAVNPSMEARIRRPASYGFSTELSKSLRHAYGYILPIILIILLIVSGLSIHLVQFITLAQKTQQYQNESLLTQEQTDRCVANARTQLMQQVSPLNVPDYKIDLDLTMQTLAWWKTQAQTCAPHSWIYWELLQHDTLMDTYYYRISVFNTAHVLTQATFKWNANTHAAQQLAWRLLPCG